MHFFTPGDLANAASTLLFQRNLLAASPACVSRNHQLGLGVVAAVGDGLGRKAAEDHRVDRHPAQASMAMANSGTIGMYMATTSPLAMPSFLSTLANLQTSRCSIS